MRYAKGFLVGFLLILRPITLAFGKSDTAEATDSSESIQMGIFSATVEDDRSWSQAVS